MLKRTLVVSMNYLGDALMTTPTLRAVHSATGRRSDVIAGGASGYGAVEVLRDNPDIADLIPRVSGGWWSRCVQLWQASRSGRYDLVVILPSIPVYRWAAQLSGVARVIYVPPSPPDAHLASHMLQYVAAQLGTPAGPLHMTLHVPDAARARVALLLAEIPRGRPLIGLSIGATRPQKRWPNQAFASLAARLTARGYTPALIGGPGDHTAAEEIKSLLDSGSVVLNLCGKTSIPELGALVERCDLLVTGDSGPMHMAAAVGTPLVALFGSTDPAQTGPVGSAPSRVLYKKLYCAPCKSHPTCGGAYDCMVSVSPAEVLIAVQETLGDAAVTALPMLDAEPSWSEQ